MTPVSECASVSRSASAVEVRVGEARTQGLDLLIPVFVIEEELGRRVNDEIHPVYRIDGAAMALTISKYGIPVFLCSCLKCLILDPVRAIASGLFRELIAGRACTRVDLHLVEELHGRSGRCALMPSWRGDEQEVQRSSGPSKCCRGE